ADRLGKFSGNSRENSETHADDPGSNRFGLTRLRARFVPLSDSRSFVSIRGKDKARLLRRTVASRATAIPPASDHSSKFPARSVHDSGRASFVRLDCR